MSQAVPALDSKRPVTICLAHKVFRDVAFPRCFPSRRALASKRLCSCSRIRLTSLRPLIGPSTRALVVQQMGAVGAVDIAGAKPLEHLSDLGQGESK
jgi:hypothetical protein